MSNIPVSIETTQSYPVSMGIAVTTKASDLSELDVTENGTYEASDGHGYNPVVVNVTPTLQSKTATPTESAQTISPDTGYDGLSSVEINAISSSYVGGDIPRKSSTDLTASGATVTAPAGYYASNASKTVQTTTLPVSASNVPGSGYMQAGIIYPDINVGYLNIPEGYVSADSYYLVQKMYLDSKSITGSGTYNASDDDLDGYSSVTVPAGSAGTPTATKGTVSNHSVSVTPSVTNATGYITGSTKTGTAVTVSASELVSGSETKTANGTYDVTNLASLIVNVSGGGGDDKAAQISQTPGRATSSTYTAVGPSITVTKTGTYDVYWSGYRSSTSGTSGSQLYINGTAYGTAQTTFNTSLTNLQSVHLTSVSLNANDVLTVRARSRGSGYYMYIQDLIIIEA